MTDVILTPVPGPTKIITSTGATAQVITASGPPGPPGPPGTVDGAFMIVNRFSELETPQAKTAARINLELQAIDCGEFL